jgi:heptosyltransferase-3
MVKPITKKIERWGKTFLKKILKFFFHHPLGLLPSLNGINKILVLRLDQRIGNGVLLLPLLRAVRLSRPASEIHLLIHYPVAATLRKYSGNLLDQIWPYYQRKILSNPFLLLKWLFELRAAKFDLILSSHNPDNFSLSQALLGKWCAPKILAGFNWKDSKDFYDLAIESSTRKHYAESQLDLWRYFDPQASLNWGGLTIPAHEIKDIYEIFGLSDYLHGALFWIGATGNKSLPHELISFLYEQIIKQTGLKITLALGPSDNHILVDLPPALKEKALIWQETLDKTAVFFAGQKIFISGDTGPAHLAVALNLPVLTIFTNTSSLQYGYHDYVKRFSLDYTGSPEDHGKLTDYLGKLGKVVREV